MTRPTTHILDLVRGQLSEARRYTHSNPEAAMHLVLDACWSLARWQCDDNRLIYMIRRNLSVGAWSMNAAPDVTDAAITLALWELGDLASQLRKADEAKGRDAELMEAYGPRGDRPR